MNSIKYRKYMGLSGFSWSTKKQLFEISEKSIYYWLWQFLRLTPEFWYAKRTGNSISNSELERINNVIGGHPGPSYKAWWDQYGFDALAEIERDDHVRLVDINLESLSANPETFVVEVPLSLTKREISSQFIRILNLKHRGRKFDVEEYSNAKFKLYNHKYNLLTIERQYWVMLYKLIYPQTPLWVIGDRLRLAPHLDVRHIDRKTVERRQEIMFLQLQSHTWRYHANAQSLRANLKLGSFPNYNKAATEDNYRPFGSNLDSDFKAMTSEKFQSGSPWQLWLKRHYQPVLIEKIKTLNRFDKHYKINEHFEKNFNKFILGTLEM